jgi:hypothetical protein
MIQKKSSSPTGNKFGVEPRDLTAAQRRELFTDYKNRLSNTRQAPTMTITFQHANSKMTTTTFRIGVAISHLRAAGSGVFHRSRTDADGRFGYDWRGSGIALPKFSDQRALLSQGEKRTLN